MKYHFSTSNVVFVGLLAILLPLISRIVSSPFTLLLISPFIFITLAVLYLSLLVYLGHSLDRTRIIPHNQLHHAARPFAFSTPAAWQAVLTRSQWSQDVPQNLPPLCPEAPEVSAALDDIISLVVRDFITSWYQELSDSPAFTLASSSIIHKSLEQLLARAAAIDLSALIVKRILPKITAHVEQFRQSEVALRGAGLERSLTQSEELDLLLASRYSGKGGGRLHPAIDNLSTTFTKQTEEAHLRRLVEKSLPYLLPQAESESKALTIVVREIVTCLVLYPVMDMMSDPDFWNRCIDQVAGAVIHQRSLINKVRLVLETQSPRTRNRLPLTAETATASEIITIRTNDRQFESFLRSINRCSSLLDARRLKNDVVGEIRRTRMSLANHENEDWINGEKTEDVVAFLDRLYTAKRRVEERIVVLGGEDESQPLVTSETNPKSGLSLRDVLRNPNSLSYFMEFMDRRQRSLPVQFWLTVESFKNPLETVDSSSSGDEDDIQDHSSSITLKEDISMINDLYFSDSATHPTLSSIPKKHVTTIREFTSNSSPSSGAQRKVRRSVLLAQRQVERDMEQDFDDFERSELWFRAIGDIAFAGHKVIFDPYARNDEMSPDLVLSEHSGMIAYPRTNVRHNSQQSESTPVLAIQRTTSANSGRSTQTVPLIQNRQPKANIEVLMSIAPDTSSDLSRAPLFDDPEDELQRAEEKRMEAIHAALTDIMALEHEPARRPALGDWTRQSEMSQYDSKQHVAFGDNPSNGETDDGDDNEPEEARDSHGSFQLAAPGDLQLSFEITRLADNIENLQAQENMLDALIKKAELTGDTKELRLLTKSKSSMTRELRELQFQKLQYEQQEAANRLLSDQTKVAIVSSTVGEEEGKSVVRYLVEVQQLAADGSFASGWMVARRYNEFLSMHTKLRERYALVRNLDFPGKRLVTALSGSFLDTRRIALERYLQSLIAIPIVCESDELRGFLSRESPFLTAGNRPSTTSKRQAPFSGAALVKNMYRSVTESIDDMFFGPSMLDVIIQRLTRQAAEFAGIVGSGVNDEDLVAQALNASGKTAPEATLMQLPGDLKPLEGETSTSWFSAPICDLVLAVFELNKKNNWLRRQAIVIILQQFLGGTIERKFRETIKSLLAESRLMIYINMFREELWPGGKLRQTTVPRTADEKIRTREEANKKLSLLVPDLAANMIGRSNARRGARRIFAVLQNRRLNQHIAYTIMDETFSALFPETTNDS